MTHSINFEIILTVFIFIITIIMVTFTWNYLFLFFGSIRTVNPGKKKFEFKAHTNLPKVTVLLATYNEKYVIVRTLRAITLFKYPKEKIQIVIVDDSTDDTKKVLELECIKYAKKGYDIKLVHRASRAGYKAGALQTALQYIKGEYILLLDADSVCMPENLLRGVNILSSQPNIDYVSYKLDHLNRPYNLITKSFALSIDFQQRVDHAGRFGWNLPFSFHGGSTLLRKSAILKIGGWKPGVLTEDAEITTRLIVNGSRGIYLRDAKVRGEDVATLEAWKRQVARVAEGYAQTFRTHYKTIWRSKMPFVHKLEISLLLLWPVSNFCWLLITLTSTILVLTGGVAALTLFQHPFYIALTLIPGIGLTIIPFYLAYTERIKIGENLTAILLLPYVMASMFLANTVGFFKGLLGRKTPFFRTPKYGLYEHAGTRKGKYKITLRKFSIIETIVALLAGIAFIFAALEGAFYLAVFLLALSSTMLASIIIR